MLIDTADRYHRRDIHPSTARAPEHGISADVLSLRAELTSGSMRRLGMFDLDVAIAWAD